MTVEISETAARVSSPRGRSLAPDVMGIYVAVLDGVLIVLSSLAIYTTYVGWTAERGPAYVAVTLAIAIITVLAFYAADLYRLEAIARPTRHLQKLIPIYSIVFLVMIGFLFALKISADLSRVWVFSWMSISLFLIWASRMVVSQRLIQRAEAGELSCNIIVVGGGQHGRRIIRHLNELGDPWNKIVGVFDDRTTRVGDSVLGVPVLGNLDDLVAYARTHRCDEIIVALPWSAERRILAFINQLKVLPVHITLGPDLAALNFLPASYRDFAGVPVLEVFRKPIAGWRELIKRAEDYVIGGLLFTASLPLMGFIAVLIKLDSPGPVLFRQRRYGFNNQLIDVYKFRTMYVEQTDPDAETLTQPGDKRITRIGDFLRRSSLDELPQFLNVLKGEMSIVGPRPHALEAKAGNRLYHEVVTQYAARHKVKPGITGWAQINGWRGVTDNDVQIRQRVDHDLYYIDNWSLLFDLKIMYRTIGTVLSARNAV